MEKSSYATNFDRILSTASDPSVRGKHAASAVRELHFLIEKTPQDRQGIKYNSESKLAHKGLDFPADGPDFADFFWQSDRWATSVNIFLQRFDSVQGKLVRSLFSAIVSSLKGLPSTEQSKVGLLNRIMLPVRSHTERIPKGALYAINYMLSSKLIAPVDILTSFDCDADSRVACDDFLQRLFFWASFTETAPAAGKLISSFLRGAPFPANPPSSQSNVVFETAVRGRNSTVLWQKPLLDTIKATPDCLFRFRSHLFPTLFTLNSSDYFAFLVRLNVISHLSGNPPSEGDERAKDGDERILLFTALQSGKELGLVYDVDDIEDDIITCAQDEAKVYIKASALTNVLFDSSAAIRLCGFSILTSSPSTTKPLPYTTLLLLKKAIPFFSMESDAGIRGEILSLFSKLIARLRGSMAAMDRAVKGSERSFEKTLFDLGHSTHTHPPTRTREELGYRLKAYTWFLNWLVNFLVGELLPGAEHHRQHFALKAIRILDVPRMATKQPAEQKIQMWPEASPSVLKKLFRLLQDLAMNPFEDIRSLSTDTLESFCQDEGFVKNDYSFEDFEKNIKKAKAQMLKSGRADHADGVAKLHGLLYRFACVRADENIAGVTPYQVVDVLFNGLSGAISTFKTDKGVAISSSSMHGFLSCLRHIIMDNNFYSGITLRPEESKTWTSLQFKIIQSIPQVWECVRDVLNHDAPEGHVPDDLEEEDDLTTKDIMSYSWRALKEASLLIKVIVSKAPMSAAAGERVIFSFEDLSMLSRLSSEWLTQLRHKGALLAANQAFSACCARIAKEGRMQLLSSLHFDALQCIHEQGGKVTRRSAGIPPMIIGVLSADPTEARIKDVVNDLKIIATMTPQNEAPESLPQVHALNCLKAILTATNLGSLSEPYITEALSIAGSCLTSNIWAIRNCGLMLFRALIDRLVGSEPSTDGDQIGNIKQSSKVSLRKYPALQKVLLELLTMSVMVDAPLQAGEMVFPALKLIQRIPPAKDMRLEIRGMVLKLAESQQWHVRSMAARTIVVLLHEDDDFRGFIHELLEGCSQLGTNGTHGRLLCVQQIVQKHAPWKRQPWRWEEMGQTWALLNRHARKILSRANCSIPNQEFLDLYVALLKDCNTQLSQGLALDDKTRSIIEKIVKGFHHLYTVVYCNKASLKGSFCLAFFLTESMCWYLTAPGDENTLYAKVSGPTVGSAIKPHIDINYEFLPLGQQGRDLDTQNDFSWVMEELLKTKDLAPKLKQMLLMNLDQYTDQGWDHDSASVAQELLCQCIDGLHWDAPKPPFQARIPLEEDYERNSALYPHLSYKRFERALLGSSQNIMAPSRVKSSIRLWSRLLSLSATVNGVDQIQSTEISQGIWIFLQSVRPLLQEHQVYDIRYAAAEALSALRQAFAPENTEIISSPYFKRDAIYKMYLLLLYDSMNDDDEDIRRITAETASKLSYRLAPNSKLTKRAMTPLAESIFIITDLLAHWDCDDTKFQQELIQRATGSNIIKQNAKSRLISIATGAKQRFAEALIENNELFQVERQNLYVSDVRESCVWTEVLKRQNIALKYLHALKSWVLEGLGVLIAHIKTTPDGPLGWTSKQETYSFIFQIINGARVLLFRAKQAGHKINIQDIKNALMEFYLQGQRGNLHPLLMEQMEKTIRRELTFTCQTVSRAMAIMACSV